MRDFQTTVKLFDAAAVAATSTVKLDVSDFRHLILAVNTLSNANFTLKIQGSIQELPPNFATSASPTNQWTYLQLKDLDTAATINGSTGVTSAGTDINAMYEVNTNAIKWISATITARSAGTVTAVLKPFNDK